MLLFLFISLFIFFVGCFINFSLSARGHKGKVTEHFDGKRFWNIGAREGKILKIEKSEDEKAINIFSFLNRPKSDWSQVVVPEVPVLKMSEELKVTHINHSTALIQVNNLNILTDPVYAYRASPFAFFGPKRFTNPRIVFDNLPDIDIVLLSHNHYDHMDLETLKRLQKKFSPKIIATLGNKDYLERKGIKNIIETDWYDNTKLNLTTNNVEINIKTVPAQHFASRGLSDRNKTLWAGYVLEIKNLKIYFVGDTGFGPFVEKVKQLYPDGFDFALIPIGAYKPRYFMSSVHINPEEALLMMKFLQIKQALAIHFGTFPMALDKQYDPEQELEGLKKREEYQNLNLYVQK